MTFSRRSLAFFGLLACAASGAVQAAPPLPALDVNAYMGTWHQLALYPNKFQAQCVANTRATYRLLEGGAVEVKNECTTATGSRDEALGQARPRGAARIEAGQLKPASLAVSFLPAALRWLPVGWGDYDVVYMAPDAQLVVVSESSQRFLWVLARERTLPDARWGELQTWLTQAGFDVARLRREPQTAAAATP
jgi:apolipoprotein D and lipocalin family protein